MNWNDFKYYLTVARVNSLTEASAALGVSASTVARRISELESGLGVSLFNKRPTGYFLSEAGEGILSLVDETEASFQFLERKMANFSGAKTRTVKIELPELLGQYFIIPELLALRNSEPGIRFEVVNSVKNSKLTSRESDVVIRLSMPKSGAYTIRKMLMYMIKMGEVATVSSYFYLVPPVTVIQTWFLFDEQMELLSLVGCVLSILGVFLVVSKSNGSVLTTHLKVRAIRKTN